MTQVSKKFIISDIAKVTCEPVNIDSVYTFRKEKDASGTPMISFYKEGTHLGHEPVMWKYNSVEERDCDYNKIIQNYSESINVIP
jgi:hypothetical protein